MPARRSRPPARYSLLKYAAVCASTRVPSSPALETSLLQPFASPLLSLEFSAHLGAVAVSWPSDPPTRIPRCSHLWVQLRFAPSSCAGEQQPGSSSQRWIVFLDSAGGKGVGSPRGLYVAVLHVLRSGQWCVTHPCVRDRILPWASNLVPCRPISTLGRISSGRAGPRPICLASHTGGMYPCLRVAPAWAEAERQVREPCKCAPPRVETLSKWTCWVCGTSPSTLQRESTRAHTIDEPK